MTPINFLSTGSRCIKWLPVAVFCMLASTGLAQKEEAIKLNQLGFLTNAPKVAVITDSTAGDRFYVLSANLRDTAFKGRLSEQRPSAYSSLKTRIADFSALKRKGAYVVMVPGIGHSYVFSIGNAVYNEVAKAVLKSYYFQRMGMPMEPAFAGRWARPEGHPDTLVYIHPSAATASRPAGTVISSPRGWYDAGDYNKYVVNSGITMGTLMAAYEDFPAYFTSLTTNIPESGNHVPDLINEVVYNLRWELTMQDPADGGVYHKCTNASFDAMIMPDQAVKPRYVVQKGTAATLDFAAVTAQAYRILKPFAKEYPGLADSCLLAARKAWQWALKNPNLIYDQRQINLDTKPAITTGEYGDRSFNDEWFWAAAELFASTKQPAYQQTLVKYRNLRAELPSWSDMTLVGYYTLLRFRNQLPAAMASLTSAFKDSLVKIADTYILKQGASAFATIMGQSSHDFVWGSNAVAANQGVLLLNAFLLTKDQKYLQAAGSNLDYILGRNATGYCFITGFGKRSPMHPHHRLSVADDVVDPVPGLLVGGPNPGRQDHCHYELLETETSYVDSDCAYASNEIAINWNAPAVYLINAIIALNR